MTIIEQIRADIEAARAESSGRIEDHIADRDDVLLAAVVRGLELAGNALIPGDDGRYQGHIDLVVASDSLGRRLATMAGYGTGARRHSPIGDPRAWADSL